jgi:hypothetical protein
MLKIINWKKNKQKPKQRIQAKFVVVRFILGEMKHLVENTILWIKSSL